MEKKRFFSQFHPYQSPKGEKITDKSSIPLIGIITLRGLLITSCKDLIIPSLWQPFDLSSNNSESEFALLKIADLPIWAQEKIECMEKPPSKRCRIRSK